MMRGPTRAADRLRRLLVVLPWLMEHGDTPVAVLAERFGISEASLIKDLELASLCGLPPYVDEMVDVYIDDDMVRVGVPRLFTKPLRLTADEGVALLAAVRAALALPGADEGGALARAVGKLSAVLGDPGELEVAVEVPPMLAAVQSGAEAGERLDITYWSAASDETTTRRIAPQAVLFERGRWYVVADDERTGQERIFRVDRIESVRPTGEGFEHRSVAVDVSSHVTASEGTRVSLRLPASGRWVTEAYPVDDVQERPDGGMDVRLSVVSRRWLERVLLRVGPEASVLDPPEWRDVGREAAARLFARYA